MTLQKLPLGKILDIQKNPIINRNWVLAFLLGILFGISIGYGISVCVNKYNVSDEVSDDLISLPTPSPISPD